MHTEVSTGRPIASDKMTLPEIAEWLKACGDHLNPLGPATNYTSKPDARVGLDMQLAAEAMKRAGVGATGTD